MNLFLQIALFIVSSASFATGTPARAAPKKSSRATLPAPLDVAQPLDKWRDITKVDFKSKHYKDLAKAEALFLKKKWMEASKTAKPFLTHGEIGDHATLLSAQAHWNHMGEKFSKETAASEIINLERALSKYPYTTLSKPLNLMLARFESMIGVKSHNQEMAMKGLERFHLVSEMRQIPLDVVQGFSADCRKRQTPLCMAWVKKLSRFYPKGSQEKRALTKVFKEASDWTMPGGPSRLTATYPSPSSSSKDQTAMDETVPACVGPEKKYSVCITLCEKFLSDFPKSVYRFRARALLALAIERDKSAEKAKPHWEQIQKEAPFGFYAILASERTGKTPQSYLQSASNQAPQGVAQEAWLNPEEIYHLDRARKFLAHDAFRLAGLEIRTLRPKSYHSNLFLNYLAFIGHEAQAPFVSFPVLSELILRGADSVNTTKFSEMIFPILKMDEIDIAAKSAQLDPITLLSLVKQESAFDPDALSSSGAQGLTQVIAITASEVDDSLSRAEQNEPEQNLRLGARYISKMIDRYNGNIAVALAAYNAGPTHASRWVRNYLKEGSKESGMIEFIEQIPFRETRDYVTSILRNIYWYRHRLKGETPKLEEFAWKPLGSVPPSPLSSPSLDENGNEKSEDSANGD